MKQLLNYILILGLLFLSYSCEKDKEKDKAEELLPDDEFPAIINEVIDVGSMDSISSMGMKLYPGSTPPNIENSYLMSPNVCFNSNIMGVFPGKKFVDFYIKFSNYNSHEHTILVDYINADVSRSNLKSYISGSGDNFAVFTPIKNYFGSDFLEYYQKPKDIEIIDSVLVIQIISGSLGDNYIEDFTYAFFILNTFGNINDIWKDEKSGHINFDRDRVSEVIPDLKSTYSEKFTLKSIVNARIENEISAIKSK